MIQENQPFLPVAEPDIGPLEEQYLLEAFRSGWISSLGEFIDRFERGFSHFCGVQHGVAVSNGTAALHLALVTAGVSPGDEVIIPALTFVATASAVRHAGAEPVFVDSEPEIGTMDPRAVEQAISRRTKAIIPVHLYGHPVDMDPIMEIAEANHLVVVEDAAEAHGAKYRGRVVGSIGHMAIFSFYGNKLLTTGEGGMVVTGDQGYDQRLRFLRDHAMDPNRRYWHPEVGFNFRMTNLQAAIGCAQLERADDLFARKRKLLATYRKALAEPHGFQFNPARDWAAPVPWLVCALLTDGTTPKQRDLIVKLLHDEGIDSRPYFIPLHQLPPFTGCRRIGIKGDQLPVAGGLAARGMNLPSSSSLKQEDVVRVCEKFAAALGTKWPFAALRLSPLGRG